MKWTTGQRKQIRMRIRAIQKNDNWSAWNAQRLLYELEGLVPTFNSL